MTNQTFLPKTFKLGNPLSFSFQKNHKNVNKLFLAVSCRLVNYGKSVSCTTLGHTKTYLHSHKFAKNILQKRLSVYLPIASSLKIATKSALLFCCDLQIRIFGKNCESSVTRLGYF